MASRVRGSLVLGGAALAGLALFVFSWARTRSSDPSGAARGVEGGPAARTSGSATARAPDSDRSARRDRFVGSRACAGCHRPEADAYEKSHHADALVLPTPEKLKTKLDQASFSSALGGTTRFDARDGGVSVTSPDESGKTRDFPIVYAAGVLPLRQFVVATERGKLQSLGVVWDSRPAAEKGQRWFHVYGPRGIAHDDSLFFTKTAQNWNHVCADCHSTFVERRYDLAADRFDTRWAELSVGCEACHGPGAEHVRAAKALGTGGGWGEGKGLVVRLTPAEPWAPSATGSPTPRKPDGVEVEVCAPCHSRRQPLYEGFLAGDAFLDAFEPELLRPTSYHADGQVEGEVYEWASFLQSRMYASGVRCSDCHEPHSATPYAQGNALCARCHAPARFEQESHSHHAGAKAPLCIDCHMPPSVFMQIDERRDHSIRIPRPDHSVEFGTPNACNGCHSKQSSSWALEWVSKWYPAARRAHFVDALGRDRKGALDAPRALAALARDPAAPAIARSTALERLGRYPTERALATLRTALASPEPLVVYGAVLGADGVPLPRRSALLLPVVGHRVRAVRIAAGKSLAGIPLAELPPEARAAVERAFAEVEESFGVSASRPEAHVERSSFELARGKVDEAEAELQTALRLAPCLSEAYLNLADLARDRRDEAAAERAIRAALGCDPRNAFAHHALGLWQVRAGDARGAVKSLRKAVELAPTETRFGYVLAIAIADGGDLEAAIKVLETTLERRPNDPELLQALAGYLGRLGQVERAAETRRKLETLLRD